MRLYLTPYLLTVFLFFIHFQVKAQTSEVFITPTPGWVTEISPDIQGQAPSGVTYGEYYRLVDRQTNMLSERESFYHYAIQLINEQAVSNHAQLSLSFNPGYQTLNIHSVGVWRNGQFIEQLLKDKIELLRREEKLEENVYSGDLTASLLLTDVRKGDILEYKYSIKGANPSYQGFFSQSTNIQWSAPLGKSFYRLLWPKSNQLDIRPINTDYRVEQRVHSSHIEYIIDNPKLDVLQTDSESPSWFDPWGKVIFSNAGSWQDVVSWAAPFYKLEDPVQPDIERVVQSITEQHRDIKSQISAALTFVQEEVRYLAVEIGQTGLTPRPAALTLARRYGDCKDKTLLLMTLLNHLGVDSYPALVHTDYGQTLEKEGPVHNAFNHVIVTFTLNGKIYWVDPSITNQKGNIDNIFQSDYGYALVLKPGDKTLVKTGQSVSGHLSVISEQIDLTGAAGEPVNLTLKTELYGLDAENFRVKYSNRGHKGTEKNYLNYYQDFYPGITPLAPIEVEDQQASNKVVVLEKYQITDFWQDDQDKQQYDGTVFTSAMYGIPNKPKMKQRTSPFEVSFPNEVDYTVTILADDTWDIEEERKTVDTPFFSYQRAYSYDPTAEKITLSYQFKALVAVIPAEQIAEYVAAVDKVHHDMDYAFYHSYAQPSANTGVTTPNSVNWLLIWFLFIILLFIYGIVELKRDAAKAPPRSQQIYYTVSPVKYGLLYMASFGFYFYYWSYKNWHYVKYRDGSKILPAMRSIFIHLTFYSLYRSLVRDKHYANKQSWFKRLVYLAITILITLSGLLLNPANTGAYLLVLLLTLPLTLPLVLAINKTGASAKQAYQFNSQWRPRHLAPLLLLISTAGLSFASFINVIPSDKLVSGDNLWSKDILFMQKLGALDIDEELVMLYSQGGLSFTEDGNALTDKKVFSYWRDEESAQIYLEQANYNQIEHFQTQQDSASDTSKFQIYRKNGSDFMLVIPLKQHKEFAQELNIRIKKANQNPV